MEHRWGRRIAIEVPVRLMVASGEPVLGHIENLSISGAFVRAAGSLPVSGRLEVEMALPGGPERKSVRVAAHLTRRTQEGVAIEWYELAPRAVRALLPRIDPLAARPMRTDMQAAATQA